MNRIFEETAKGRIIKPIWLTILVMIGLYLAGLLAGGILLGLPTGLYLAISQGSSGSFAMKGDLSFLLSLYALFGTYVVVFFWTRYVEKRPFTSVGFFKGKVIKEILQGWLIGVGLFTGLIALLFLFGMADVTKVSLSVNSLGIFLIYLIGWQIQSGSEELLTRGWLLPVLATHHKKAVAVAISSLLFGVLHLLNANVSLISILNISLFGFFMCLYVLLKGDIWGVCAIHASWNCFQGSVFGISVSGSNALKSSLIHLNLKGNEWLTGGDFGIEGSILTSIALGFACLYLFSKVRKEQDLLS